MLTNPVDSIREKNAKFLRDVEYIKETAFDDMIDERLEVAESMYEGETFDEIKEAMDLASKISGEDDVEESAKEIQRILDADEDITFNEMVGIE